MKWCKNFLVVLALFTFVACTKTPKADTPEGALEKYVTYAFAVKSPEDKKKLMELSTDDALYFLENMSDEDFRRQFIDSDLKFVSMKAKDKREENTGDVSLVYELNYRQGKDVNQIVHTNKKIAYLTKNQESGEWKIKSTKNLKSFLEVKDVLVVTPETTDKNGGATSK